MFIIKANANASDVVLCISSNVDQYRSVVNRSVIIKTNLQMQRR